MEQRRLRLGDILDDYCPRERRVTNHAIVAMIEEDVKQTRCTTCDAEHAYKGGKLPRRRKKETPGTLYKEVLAGMPDAEGGAAPGAPVAADPVRDSEPLSREAAGADARVEDVKAGADEPAPPAAEELREDAPSPTDEGPVHRPLIRATLPRPEGQKDTRPVPEFTIRHAAGRSGNGHFRGPRAPRGHAGPGANGNGNRGPGVRFHGSRSPGHGRGARPEQGRGTRPDQSRGPGGGRGQGRGQGGGFRGRKRSR